MPEPLLIDLEGVVEVRIAGQFWLISIGANLRSLGIKDELVRRNVTWVGLKMWASYTIDSVFQVAAPIARNVRGRLHCWDETASGLVRDSIRFDIVRTRNIGETEAA